MLLEAISSHVQAAGKREFDAMMGTVGRRLGVTGSDFEPLVTELGPAKCGVELKLLRRALCSAELSTYDVNLRAWAAA